MEAAKLKELAGVADLKAHRIADWRAGLLSDASSRFSNPLASRAVARVIAGGDAEVLVWMESIARGPTFSEIAIVDPAGRTLISAGPRAVRIGAPAGLAFEEASKCFCPAITDLHAGQSEGVHLDLAVPVSVPEKPGSVVAFLVLRVDPARELYPMVLQWANPGKTDDVALVQREGDIAQFVYGFHFKEQDALKRSSPLKAGGMAADAASGRSTAGLRVDRSGIPVLAVTRAISGTHWGLVVKSEVAELHAPMHARAWQLAFLAGAILLAAGAALGMIWRHQTSRHYLRLYRMERDRQAHAEWFRRIVEETEAGYFRLGRDGRFEDVNRAWLVMHGMSDSAEIIGCHFSCTELPERLAAAEQVVAKVLAGERISGEEFSRVRADGSVAHHTFSVNPVMSGQQVVGVEGFLIDNTELRNARQAKVEIEQRYRALVESMHEGVAIHQMTHVDGVPANYIILDVNRQYEEIVGLRRADVTGRLATDAYGVPAAPYLDEYAAALASRQTAQFEAYFAPMERHFAISVAPLEGDLFATVFFDITQARADAERLRQAHQTLLDRERRYHTLFNSGGDAAVVFGFEEDGLPGRFIEVNDVACQRLGYSREEMLQKRPMDVDAPKTIPGIPAAMERLQTVGKAVWEGCHVTKDGRRIPVEISAHLVDFDGERIAYALARDITERMQAESELRRSEERFRTIVETAEEGILEIDFDGKILFTNRRYADLMGRTVEEMTGRQLSSFLEEPQRAALAQRLERRRQGLHDQYTLPFRRPDGTEVWQLISASPLRDSGGAIVGILAMVTDITPRIKAEQEMRRMYSDLRALSRDLPRSQDDEKRRFARELHDSTAQLLAGLSMNLALVQKPWVVPERAKSLIAESEALAERCSREIRAISYMLHPPLLDELGLGSALHAYAGGFGKRTGIQLEIHIPADFGRLDEYAETNLFRIVQESLANLRRLPENPRASVRLVRDAEAVTLEVSDLGEGFPLGSTGSDVWECGQWGVGIVGMRERAHQLEGTLRIESGPAGTRVVVTIPIERIGRAS